MLQIFELANKHVTACQPKKASDDGSLGQAEYTDCTSVSAWRRALLLLVRLGSQPDNLKKITSTRLGLETPLSLFREYVHTPSLGTGVDELACIWVAHK